ncbi:hypothetical protein Nepgr_029556 [Nepenthes gracilis]|uniref:Pentatricopeptide repeat-containing protein n=1 Tax=Nepenthes gracilis TaxID=150966 RepID=A0AAD3TEH3_NEPGR|nr:hypothetical protein Nepgr_029556 [Nepenthes gracilis]
MLPDQLQMKQLLKLRRLFPSKPHSLRPFSSSSLSTPENVSLSPEEIAKINLLMPRLCNSDRVRDAVRLAEAALMAASPPPKSLSISILVDRLSENPDMADSMALLNRLKHNPRTHFSLLAVIHMLLSSYFGKKKPKEALKVFNWMLRPDSPSPPNPAVYGVLICGFCGNSMLFEGLKVLRQMISSNCALEMEVRMAVYRGLLREARIREAKELNEKLECIGDGVSDGAEKVLKLIDEIISKWEV